MAHHERCLAPYSSNATGIVKEFFMKRFIAVLFAITVICGIALADSEIIVGFDVELPDFKEANVVNSRLYASYDRSFMDDTLELFTEASLIMTDFSDLQTGMGLEVDVTYNLGLANENYLHFMLNSYTEIPFDRNASVYSGLIPKVLFGHNTGAFGYVYFQVDVPITLHDEGVGAFDEVRLDLTFKLFRRRGKDSGYPDRFGFKTKLQTKLNGADYFFYKLRFVPYFASGIFYGEVEINIPIFENGMNTTGMSIIPEIDIDIPALDGLSLWLNLPINHIGAGNGNNTSVGLGMGVSFTF